MENLVLTLDEKDLITIQAILMDRDEAAALAFLEKRIAARLPQRGASPCDSTRINPYLMRPDGTT